MATATTTHPVSEASHHRIAAAYDAYARAQAALQLTLVTVSEALGLAPAADAAYSLDQQGFVETISLPDPEPATEEEVLA